MLATNFSYAGKYLSDYNFIIADFDYATGFKTSTVGGNITFNKVKRSGGKKYSLTSSTFDETITTTFDICKDYSLYNHEEMEITNDEFRSIARWLLQQDYKEFYFINNDDSDTRIFNASFKIEKITFWSRVVGIRLTVETDKPYAVGRTITKSFTLPNSSSTYNLKCLSDLVGYTPIKMKITCNAVGDLEITNAATGRLTQIKNCSVGEIININSNTEIITSSLTSHDLANDFNFMYQLLSNDLSSRDNIYSANKNCSIEISYDPVILYCD